MKYYKNELGQIVPVEDQTWERFKRVQPDLIAKEVNPFEEKPIKIKKVKEIDKLKSGNHDESKNTGATAKRKRPEHPASEGGSGVLDPVKRKPGRQKKVQTDTGNAEGNAEGDDKGDNK